MSSKTLYWLSIAALVALALSVPHTDADAVKCSIDGKPCERLKDCALNCEKCKDNDVCCCRHRDACTCVDPTTGKPCCDDEARR